jgi:hypothetical protein
MCIITFVIHTILNEVSQLIDSILLTFINLEYS